MSALFAGIAEGLRVLGEAMLDALQLVHKADVLARRYRWCVSTSWPATLIMEIGAMAEKSAPKTAVDRRVLSFYRNDEWAELEKLVESACTHESLHPTRRKALRDMVLMMKAGDRDGFNAATFALPTLFAQLEGVLRDYSRAGQTTTLRSKKTITVREMLRPLGAVAFPIERPALRLVANLLFKSHHNGDPPAGKRLNRHRWLHGRTHAAALAADVIRVALVIDLISNLIDRSRGPISETIELRMAWAEFLSESVGAGKQIRAIRLSAASANLVTEHQPLPWRDALYLPKQP